MRIAESHSLLAPDGRYVWARPVLTSAVTYAWLTVLVLAAVIPASFIVGALMDLLAGHGSRALRVVVIVACGAVMVPLLRVFVRMLLWVTPRVLRRRSERLATLVVNGPTARGQVVERCTVVAAPTTELPVVCRTATKDDPKYRPELVVTSQLFVVRGDAGPLLVDTPYIEAGGGAPSRADRESVWRELEIGVGDEILLTGGTEDQAKYPTWFLDEGASHGYRDRTIRRIRGSEADPVRIWTFGAAKRLRRKSAGAG